MVLSRIAEPCVTDRAQAPLPVRGMRRVVILFAALLVLPLGGSAAAADSADPDGCTWGASSVVAELNGDAVVVSEPVTSGCIPR